MNRKDSKWWSGGHTSEWWDSLSRSDRERFLAGLKGEEIDDFFYDWRVWGRDEQLAPDWDWDTWLLLTGRGWGKALDLSTPIPTPDGWTTMGEIKTGDQVYDEDGRVCRVVKAHDILQNRDCYRVVFSDGSEIIADGEHLWATETANDRKAAGRNHKRPLGVRTTVEIRKTLNKPGLKRERNHSVPAAYPLQATHAVLPIEPYLLGAWLGDGTSKCGEITTADPEVIEAFAAAGEPIGKVRAAGGRSSTYTISAGYIGGAAGKAKTFHGRLRELGVLNNKHIPQRYLRAAQGQRLLLLQGLMDTDGYAEGSKAEFCTTKAALASGVFELIASLGMIPRIYEDRARLNGVDCGPRYRVAFRPRLPVFQLARKQAKVAPLGAQESRTRRRYIVAVEPVESRPVRCITVDSPSALYLAGRGMIPTHNTRTAVEFLQDKVDNAPYPLRIAIVGQGEDDVRNVMVEGEALWTGTLIPTPEGWTTMGAIKPGDRVYARDGSITTVVAATPVWENRPCYSVTADGADPIVADERHLWVTSNRAERRNRHARRERVRSTAELCGDISPRRADLLEHEIPIHGAIEGNDVELPVPPYTLGAWLGDGDTRGYGAFTCHPADAEIVDRIREDGFEVNPRVGSYAWGILKLRTLLRAGNLTGHKHIPETYLRANAGHRLALLRGLMDTDGYVSVRGQCAFDNTSLTLVQDVRELLLTLGFKPGSIQHKPDARGHKTMYRLTFRRPEGAPSPFHLHRKTARCGVSKRAGGRLIRRIEKVASRPVRCIQVAHESGTFLAGEDFVVTHNSGFIACAPPRNKPKYYPSKGGGVLIWPNGCQAFIYSIVDTEALRGPQFHYGWCDEPMAAPRAQRERALDNLEFCLRLGAHPQLVITTTPKPDPWLREMEKQAKNPDEFKIAITRGHMDENRRNLAANFLKKIGRKYGGTKKGKQEIEGKILGDEEGALWTEELLDLHRLESADPYDMVDECTKILVAIDPNTKGATVAATRKKLAHAAGIIVVGAKGRERYVLADRSVGGGPSKWTRAAIAAAEEFDADEIIAESNQGGEMIKMVLEQTMADADYVVPVHLTWSKKDKAGRAEPASNVYDRGHVHHVGPKEQFADMEMQMLYLHEGEDPTGEDFDRCDALVWGLTRLGLKKKAFSGKANRSAGIRTFGDFSSGPDEQRSQPGHHANGGDPDL